MTTKFGTGGGGGGGGGLLPTQAIIDDGQQITATNGQTISVAVADNVPSLTIKNWAFWEPFTVTAAALPDGSIGYNSLPSAGDITNQPVSGYVLGSIGVSASGYFKILIYGPQPLGAELVGALIGIGETTYSPTAITAYYESDSPDEWATEIGVFGVNPVWTVDQQIPIVIIPQNGG